MISNSQVRLVEGHPLRDEIFIMGLPNDEVGLSPTSTKILGECAIPVTPATLNKSFPNNSTLISRPQNSALDTGAVNFHFAKPKLPTPIFTSRSKAKLVGGIATPLNTPGVSLDSPQTNRTNSKVTDSSSSGNPTHLNENVANSSKTFPPKSPIAQDTAETPCGPNTEIACISKETTCIPESDYRAKDEFENDTPKQGNDLTDNHTQTARLVAQGDSSRVSPNIPTGSPASSRSHSQEPDSAPLRPLPKSVKPGPKLMLNSKVTKRQTSPKPGLNGAVANQLTLQKEPSFSSPKPSEEDLFYMLIHRLKKRDEMEAEATAIKERMENEMFKLNRANDNLRCKLQESESICKNQQEQLHARNSFVERWKAKFSKLRMFIASIGNEFEVLRKEGKFLKSTQDSLFQEKEHIHEALKQMSKSTDQLKTRWSQHRTTITGARQELNHLEKSLLVATTKVTNTEKLVSMERTRVATLENYIKNTSERHQKQATEIEQNQSRTITKIDAIHKHLEGSWNFSQSSTQDEMKSGFSSCISLLESLGQQQIVKPQDLDKVNGAIRDLSTQLNFSIEESNKAIETAFDLHTNHGKRMSTQLTGLETAMNSNTAAVGQLSEVRELYGGLHEKLNAAEKNLDEVSADRDRLKSQEAALQRHIGDLKHEISSLQKDKIEDIQFKAADMSSELQIQLEATSAALTEVTYELRTKENEINEMELKLTEAIEKLGAAESEIADLKSENLNIHDEVQKTEHRVREELTRANLAAKDQHRAWFEQERHKLKREKILVEKNLQKAGEELASLKSSLQAEEKHKHDLITKMNQGQAEVDSLKLAATKRNSDISMEINELKKHHASAITEAQSIQGQLETVAKEKEELKHQLSELRINLAILQEQEPLRDTLQALQYEIAEKDINLLSLKEELSKSEDNTKTISRLQQEVVDKSADITLLRERLDTILTANVSMEESFKKKNNELITLHQSIEAKITAENSTLRKDVEQKEHELGGLRSQLQEVNYLFESAETILRQVGSIETGESLRNCLGVLQSRLKVMAGVPGEKQAKKHTGSGLLIPLRASSKLQETSRKQTMSSTHAECVRPGSSTRERQTTELVYRTHSTREIISPTSKTPSSRHRDVYKRQPTTPGFSDRRCSQFQIDTIPPPNPTNQISPVSKLMDFNASGNAKDLGVNQVHTPVVRNHSEGDDTLLLTCDVDTTEEQSALPISNAINDAMCASRRDKEPKQPGNPINPKETLEVMGNQNAPINGSEGRGAVINVGIEKRCRSPLRTTAGTLKRKEMPGDEMYTMDKEAGSQKLSEQLSRQGILKDTTKLSSSTLESMVQTPPHEKNGETPLGRSSKLTLRRPSRKSKYFNPTMSPATSNTARGRCGSIANKLSTPAGRARERPRRRQRGDLYNTRFSKNPPM